MEEKRGRRFNWLRASPLDVASASSRNRKEEENQEGQMSMG
jgi:hypothetical protein